MLSGRKLRAFQREQDGLGSAEIAVSKPAGFFERQLEAHLALEATQSRAAGALDGATAGPSRGLRPTRSRRSNQDRQGRPEQRLDVDGDAFVSHPRDGLLRLFRAEAQVRQRGQRFGAGLIFGLLLRDVRFTEDLSRAMSVVSLAEQSEIVDRRRASPREGLLVLEGDVALLAAAVTVIVDEGALESIALPA